jgi:hypothetical protein
MLHPLATSSISPEAMWLIVACAGMAVLYVLLRPKKRADPLATVPRFSLSRQRDVEQQMQNLLVELSEMARQITAQLDTRAARLELLIKEADEKLAALRKATGVAAPLLPAEPATAQDVELAPPTVEAKPAEIDARHAEVYRLADEGRGANEISRLVNRPMGEIELILALRPK